MGEEQWYTNKDLFEQLNTMRGEFRNLSSEMKETRAIIKQYNGLREEVGKAREEIDELREQVELSEARANGHGEVFTGIREWGGWLVAIVAAVVALMQYLN